MPRSQAQGAPAAPSPVSRLGSTAKAPATHDGALRAGGRAGAFKRPSGVRAAAAVGTHVNSTRVQGGHSTSHMPAPSACSCPFLHQPPSSLGCVPPLGWQHPTVSPKICKTRATPYCALPYMQPGSSVPRHPERCVGTLWASLHDPAQLQHFARATCVPPPCLALGMLHSLPAPYSSLRTAQYCRTHHPVLGMCQPYPVGQSTASLAAQPADRGDSQLHRGTLLETKGLQQDPHLPWHSGPQPDWLVVLGLN